MIKVTEDGIEMTPPIKLKKEDLEFIADMFREFSDHEKHYMLKDDKCDD